MQNTLLAIVHFDYALGPSPSIEQTFVLKNVSQARESDFLQNNVLINIDADFDTFVDENKWCLAFRCGSTPYHDRLRK